MSSDPFFSVVIPTYNRADFIVKTLHSVLAQTYTRFEIIIIDNCSTDNTEELLQPFINSGQVRFFRQEQNRERAVSRNRGMSLATGDFVTLLDSDDLMYPSNLADAAEYACAHPDVKCFYNLNEIVDADGHLVYRPPVPSLADQRRAISEGNFMACIGDFIHREIYTRYAFDTHPSLIGAEDWEFWLRVLADYQVGRIERVNSGIVQHAGRSVSNQDLQSLHAGHELLAEKLAHDPHLRAVYGPYLKRIEATSLIYLAILANTGAIYRTTLHYLRRAAAKDWSVVATTRFIRILQLALFGMVKARS